MIETRRLKIIAFFVQIILSFVLSRKIINIYNEIARKYGNVTVKHFRKYEKLEHKKKKLKLNIDFLSNCKEHDVYPKLFIFKLPNVSNEDPLSNFKKSFIGPSISVINNSNIFQKNSVYLKTLYLNSFLLLTSTSLQNL